MEPFLRGRQAPSVTRKMSTCLSYQSTQTINHPLPTSRRGRAVGEPLLTEPSQGSGGNCWDPPGLPRFSREVTGYSDNRWTSRVGHQAPTLFPSIWSQGWREAYSPRGPSHSVVVRGRDSKVSIRCKETDQPLSLHSLCPECLRGFSCQEGCPGVSISLRPRCPVDPR
jgi:hypothetical protein